MNPGIDEPVMGFPSIELIATAGWSARTAMEDQTIHIWGFRAPPSVKTAVAPGR